MAATVTQPVLVYNRIAQNRRKTMFLVVIAVASILPFVAALSFGAAEWVTSHFGHSASSMPVLPAAPSASDLEPAEQRAFEAEYEKIRSMQLHRQGEDEKMRMEVMILFALGLTAVLGLLFWGLVSSPTSQVLSLCGARPGGEAEKEAKRILENLAIGAGLPTPKLYVIDSSVPNAFAAGMDPAHSVVAVTSGLLRILDHRELEGVLAHELSHIGNRDTRLNTVVTAIALFLRLPYLMRQRSIKERRQARDHNTSLMGGFRSPYRIFMAPIFLYVFFIAPFMAAVIRSAISRSREYLADADAALLTRYPEGLLRALAKIRGAGSVVEGSGNTIISHLYFADPSQPGGLMSFLTGSLLATHPPIENRIQRLLEFNGGTPMSVIETALREGADYGRKHPALKDNAPVATMVQDELSVLTVGNPMGRVHRVLSDTHVYDQPQLSSRTLTRVPAGSLIVVFDDPGPFRQVLTHDQTFGYMPKSVKLQRVDMMPAEIHDPAARAAVEAAHAAQVAAKAVADANTGPAGLTPKQLAITAVFGVVVFAGIFLVLLKLG